MLDQRAYSILTIKSVDEGARRITGTATTPVPDRQGDIVEPLGARFPKELPLLLHHNKELPVGVARFKTPTKDGIEFEAELPRIEEPGDVQREVDRAWTSIKHKLIRGVSIGFRVLNNAVEPLKSGGLRFLETEILELSLVTIPANQHASISLIKSLDAAALKGTAAPSRSPLPAVAGAPTTGTAMLTIAEQKVAARSQMTEKSTRLQELADLSQTEAGLTTEDATERDTIIKDIGDLDKNIQMLSALELAMCGQAQPIPTKAAAVAVAATTPRVQVVTLDKGIRFARVGLAIAAGKGSLSDTMEYAKRWKGQTPEVFELVKQMVTKAVEGTSVVQSPGWGGELVNPNTAMTEFVELLMPQTIIGQVPGFDRVPFNIPIITQTGGSTFDWVDEGGVKPVGELAFERDTMGYAKCAGIIVMTEELVRFSSPSAEARARDDMVKQCRKFLDEQFIQAAVSAGSTSPASITNGVASPAASGTDVDALKADLMTAFGTFTAASIPLKGLVIVTTPEVALGISLLTNALGQTPAGFNVTPSGGTLLGYPVIVSESVDPGTLVIFKPSEIFLADDGQVRLDASNQATLDMSGSTSPVFSLWQRNCIGLRAERFINWKKKRSAVVAVIDTAAYGPTVSP